MSCTAHILFSMQIDGEYLMLPTTELDIENGLAERCGLLDEVNPDESASILDAVVAAHRHILGSEFDFDDCSAFLEMHDDQWLSRAFGKPARFSGFAINGEYAVDTESPYEHAGYRGLAFNQAPLRDGDQVDVFVFQDSYGMDYYTYFLLDGKRMHTLDLAPGQQASLALEGLMYGFGGPMTPQDRIRHMFISTVPNAQIVLAETDTGDMSPLEGAATDAEGNVTVCFDQPGRYYLSALGGECKFNSSLTHPWLEVNVA